MSAPNSETPAGLARRRRRLAQYLFLACTGSFLVLVLAMALWPAIFAMRLGDSMVTLAMLFGALEMALILGATALFARAANALQDREETREQDS